MKSMNYRTEHDPLGEKKVPASALYGIHTQRASENFHISGQTLPLAVFDAIAELKIAAAQANCELGFLEQKKTEAIATAGKEILQGKHDQNFVIDAFQAGAGTPTNMNVNEVMANRALELLGKQRGEYLTIHPNDDVNKGQSTNNVVPSAVKMVCYRQSQTLIAALQQLQIAFSKKAEELKSILKTGRTHLQDAVPITLGQEFNAYATTIEKDVVRIKQTFPALLELNIGKNAIGTGINTAPEFSPVIIKHLNKLTGVSWKTCKDPIYATQNHSCFLELSSALRMLAVDVNKVANDLKLLSSGPHTGLDEITLPAVEPGSSIMPGKVNPSIPEMMNMVCYQVIGNDVCVSEAVQSGQLELNVMTPVVAKNLVESITILTNGAATFNNLCIKGITANKKRCQQYFEQSAGLATFLNPMIGYEKAAEVVKESIKSRKTIRQVIIEKRILSKKEVDELLDYKKVTQPNLKRKHI